MRILHYSDPHIPTPLHRVPLAKWFSKRAIGGANLFLGRYRLFADGPEKLGALARFKKDNQVDLVICTGDYTALGLNHEYQEAVQTVKQLMDAPLGYINVPGNHDYYVTDALREERFRTYFEDTLNSDLPEYQVDGPWPLVRLVGDDVVVIALNSSRPNPLPWRSSGRIPEIQLEMLVHLANDSELKNRLAVVITHYAPLLADGTSDSKLHGLTNAQHFLTSCAQFRKAIVLCGHVHQCYHVKIPDTGQSIYCAGSATMEGKEGFWIFDVNGDQMLATQGRWDGENYQLDGNSAVNLTWKTVEEC